jgi:hypothetical protein
VAHTVYLHVGTPKSGTTYVQAVLAANKQRLRDEVRLLYPGRNWSDQVRATRDMIGANPHGDHDESTEGAWQRMADEIAAWDGAAVVSMEWLGSAGRKQVPQIVESLRPAQVEVIVTARDLARTIPAAWQEFVQNWNPWEWDEFLAAISAENPKATPAGRVFWVQQDLGRLLAVWRDVLPVDRLHVVTVPPRGAPAGELWKRFASVLGLDPYRFDATGGGSNESLGLESTELFLRLNRASRLNNMTWDVYRESLKSTLAKRGLSRRRPSETAIALPERMHGWVRACAADQVEAVRSSGVDVVGDLADLEPKLESGGAEPGTASDAAVLDAAVEGLVFLADNRAKEIQRLRAANAQLRQQLSGQRSRPAAKKNAQKKGAQKGAQKEAPEKSAQGTPSQGARQPTGGSPGGWRNRLRRLGGRGPDARERGRR